MGRNPQGIWPLHFFFERSTTAGRCMHPPGQPRGDSPTDEKIPVGCDPRHTPRVPDDEIAHAGRLVAEHPQRHRVHFKELQSMQ